MRILIADDDRITTMMVGRTLTSWGFEVTVVHDGVAAWECVIGPDAPSIVLVDWTMPRVDGLEVCRRIRRLSPPSRPYVILVTGRTSPEDLAAGIDAGADDYLAKPFDPDELRARIRVGERTLE